MNSKQETQTQTSNVRVPWAEQIPYLRDAFSEAQKLYGQGISGLYNGEQVAGFNPDQLANFRSMLEFANNSTIPGQTQAAGTSLLGSGQDAIQKALGGLAGFRPSGSTEGNIEAARLYADNPAIGGMVDAAMRDSVRNASESVLPSLARQSAAGGNLNSNRRAISEGIVQRGLADQAGDISSNLRGQAYSQGLNLAQNQSQFADRAILDAMMGQGSLGSSTSQMGLGALDSSLGQQSNLFTLAGLGGSGLRDASQAGIDNAKAKAEYATGAPYDLLARYFGIVGNPGYGFSEQGTGTSTTTKSDPLGAIGAGVGIFGKIFSDRRLKEDIRSVGVLDNGLTVYLFRYKGREGYHLGLMADEVEEIHPEAVSSIYGYKLVDYAKAVQDV